MRALIRKARKFAIRIERRNLWAVSFQRLVRLSQPRPDPALKAMFDRTGVGFIHIPKTAGTSVEAALYGHSIKHRPWHTLQQLDPEGFKRWHKFAIVREPVDRFLSAYDYLSRGGRNHLDREFARRFIAGVEVNEFAQHLHSPAFRSRVTQWIHFQPQVDYVATCEGRLMVDTLIAFERLEQDIQTLPGANGIALSPINPTPGPRTPREHLTEPSFVILADIYERDFGLHRLALGHARSCR